MSSTRPHVSTAASVTYQSDTAPLRRVLLKHARAAFVDRRSIDRQWRSLGYTAPPDFDTACRESDALAALLDRLGVKVAWMEPGDTGLDSIYVRDAAMICDSGAVLCRMGKAARSAEPDAHRAAFERLGIPVLGGIGGGRHPKEGDAHREEADAHPPGEGGGAHLEGGDVAWVGPRTLAVGRGYRTDAAGISALRALLGGAVEEMLVVPLPHWRGPEDVFHLMSMFSPVADDLALVYAPLLPVPFRQELLLRGIELVEVPDEEFTTQGCNVLAVAPRVVVAVDGNPRTRRKLEAAGVEVHLYRGAEISLKGGGGPTCLTRPLERSAAQLE